MMMNIKFHCRNDEHCSAETKPFTIEISAEAVMDENNMASVFCPHCNRTLKATGWTGDCKSRNHQP
jgi:hypothetical protein